MSKAIFPKEILQNTSESHFSKNSTRSKVIYIIIIASIVTALFLLPFIQVDVGIRSQGVVRPVSEMQALVSLMPGRLEQMEVMVNDFVPQGGLIARIASPLIDEKLTYNLSKRNQTELQIIDLNVLLRLDSVSVMQPPDFYTPHYRNSWQEVRQRLQMAQLRASAASGELERNKTLLRKGFTSMNLHDDLLYRWKNAISDYHLILDHQKNIWQTDLNRLLEEFDRLIAEKNQLGKEREFYQIRSPVSGTIQNIAGIAPGSLIYQNQVIAEISPDTSLIIEVYVVPDDIGLIRENMNVRLQVSAFNYNQWGVLEAVVTGISKDVDISGAIPYFRVRCTPERTYLTLRNGYRGNLKMGMTVQARFIVNRRSLLQLLYDKVDDWINPEWGENNYAARKITEQRVRP